MSPQRTTLDARALFIRHLDLRRARGGRGVVPCIFHKDRTPSLSVDVDRGLFNCFACGERGGVRRFAELVGERSAAAGPRNSPNLINFLQRRTPAESELQQARRRVMDDERRRQAKMARWRPYLCTMAWLRRQEAVIAQVRATATDDAAGWQALEYAAVLERFVQARTAEIEAGGRIA